MNENQIMQALEICSQNGACTGCPYYKITSESCQECLADDALALIQKQREEINELTGKHWNECGQIAKYSDELNQFADIGKMYSEIKSEAIKEFAEKLKSNYTTFNISSMVSLDMIFCDINRLLKEMAGGEDNES